MSKYPHQQEAPEIGYNAHTQALQVGSRNNESTAPPMSQDVAPSNDQNEVYFDRDLPVDKKYNADCTIILFICLIPVGGFIILMLVSILLRNML